MNDRRPNSSMDTAVGFAHRSTQTMTIAAPRAAVHAALFDMGRWADRLVHVTAIDVLYDDGRNQEFHMTVDSGDSSVTVRSVRSCRDGLIDFFQPVPPPYLTNHGGTWRFTDNGDGTTLVEVTHVWNLAPNAADWFPAGPAGSTAERVRDVLAEHSRLALTRWHDLFAGTTTDGASLEDIGDSVVLVEARKARVATVHAEADVDARPSDVYEVYADLEQWPRHFENVLAAEITYDDGYNQEFTMTVVKDGRVETVRGVRFLRRPDEIEMCHFTPPPGMSTFRSRRTFGARDGGGARVVELREFARADGTAPEDGPHVGTGDGYAEGLRELLEQRIRDAAAVERVA